MKKNIGAITLKIIALIVAKDIIESFADLFFKNGTNATGINNVMLVNLLEFSSRLISSPWLWLGILLYMVNFFLWITILSRIDLSVAFPIASLPYIIVPLLAIFFLHENVNLLRWVGIFIIIAGIVLISKTAGNKEA